MGHDGRRLGLIIVLVVGIGGCLDRSHSNPDAPGGELYQKWQSSGERMLVEDPERDETVAKLRRRSDRYKVYDSDLAPEGFVHVDRVTTSNDATGADAGEGAGFEPPVVASITGDDRRRVERVSPSVYEYANQFRLERTNRGWVVFGGPDAEWSGRLIERDGTWRLERRSTDTVWRVVDEGGAEVLRTDDRRLLEVEIGSISPPMLLALGIERLSLRARVALGQIFRHIGADPGAGGG
jgi:hypothetical protein